MSAGVPSLVGALWRDHRRAVLLVGAASVALMLTEGIGLLLLLPMLRLVGVSLGDGASDRIAALFESAMRAVGVTPNLEGVLATVVLIVALRALVMYLRARWDAQLETDVVARLRTRLFEAVVATPWGRFVGERPAAVVHALGPQVDDVHSALEMLLQGAALALVMLATAGVALAVAPALTLVVAMAGVLLFALARLMRLPGRADGDRLLAAATLLFARVSEFVGGMKMIHAHGAEARAAAAVSSDVRGWATLTQLFAHRRAAVRAILLVASAALLAGLVWLSVAQLGLAPGTLLLLVVLYARLVPQITELQSLLSELSQASASYASITALLRRCEAARREQDARGAASRSAAAPVAQLADSAPAIALRSLTVRYAGSARPALASCSASMPAGALTAVIGPSGAGKTTLADVLLGLLDAESGEVLVDGVPLASLPREAWRARVGYLAQEPMLVHGTVRENLSFARPDATEQEMRAALRDAACDFVERLPEGLDAPIGDRGVMLSGGERQRLALARALLREPTLLVLDEATSALDADTEARILQTVQSLRGRCTVVFCTHRDAVRAVADGVVVL